MNDLLVIGSGLAGLTAAWQASQCGKRVQLIAKGWGATHWHAGCVDVLGYWPLESDTATSVSLSTGVTNPTSKLVELITENRQHPYALVGIETLVKALDGFKQLCMAAGYPLLGSLEKNWLLPSAVGTFRPTCLAPATMTAGDLTNDAPMLLVGFEQLVDFFPNIAADNLTQQGIPARHVMLDLPTLAQRHMLTSVILARLMEQPAFRAEVVAAVKPHLGAAQRVGFPAVLGMEQTTAVHQDLQVQLGRPIFEIPGLPPSVAGMRLHHILKTAVEKNGGRVFAGMEAVGFEAEGGRVTAVQTEAAARNRSHHYQQYVLATGGLLGGGITTNHLGEVKEVVFDLPVQGTDGRQSWFRQDFMDARGHPIYRAGIQVDDALRPVDGYGRVLYENLYAAGTTLAHCEAIRERSFDGIALATGYAVGQV
ncbi:MAG: glycerol-3-phosphate dehydrogenase subunit GlpB [Chloroflexi bacterium]|nr:glycerol-3-phosphate dehydrogenase subunit GlpB [Chloroflexota bacterium]